MRQGGAAEEADVGAAGCTSGAVGRRWEEVSAPGMRMGDAGAEIRDPVRWPPAAAVQMGPRALS